MKNLLSLITHPERMVYSWGLLTKYDRNYRWFATDIGTRTFVNGEDWLHRRHDQSAARSPFRSSSYHSITILGVEPAGKFTLLSEGRICDDGADGIETCRSYGPLYHLGVVSAICKLVKPCACPVSRFKSSEKTFNWNPLSEFFFEHRANLHYVFLPIRASACARPMPYRYRELAYQGTVLMSGEYLVWFVQMYVLLKNVGQVRLRCSSHTFGSVGMSIQKFERKWAYQVFETHTEF